MDDDVSAPPRPETVSEVRVDTEDRTEAFDVLRALFEPRSVPGTGSSMDVTDLAVATDPFHFRMLARNAEPLSIAHIQHTSTLAVRAVDMNLLMLVAPLDGSTTVEHAGGVTTVVGGDAVLMPAEGRFTATSIHLDALTVSIPVALAARRAQELSGLDMESFRFEALTPLSSGTLRYWRSVVGLVNRELAAPDSTLGSPLVRTAILTALVDATLATFPNTTMHVSRTVGAGSTTPATVRRALEYVDEHAAEPMTPTDIAEHARVGVRALQMAFRRHLDVTLMEHVRRVRLERAYRDLQAADPTRGDTVAAVMTRWGFTNHGRFTTAYRERYGVAPADTLRS